MAEMRLIDVDAFGMYLADVQLANRGRKDVFCGLLDDVMDALNDFPEVDAVEVVRCKDCRHWDSETGWCNQNSEFDDHDMDWNIYNDCDFCSYGERRNDG